LSKFIVILVATICMMLRTNREVMKMESSPAADAPEHHMVDVVEKVIADFDDRIFPIVVVSFLLLLDSSLTLAEWYAAGNCAIAVITFGLIGCSRLSTLNRVDATTTLQHASLLIYFSDQMLASAAVPNAVLVISKTAALTTNERCGGRMPASAGLTLLHVSHAEFVVPWQDLENFAQACNLRSRHDRYAV